MNKITRLYAFIALLAMTAPVSIFANYPSSEMAEANSSSQQQQIYNNDQYSQEIQNQSDDPNPEMIGDRSWETTSNRMNRQAAATSNTRSNPNQNRSEQTRDGSWETTSSRMNRQAADAANTRPNATWIRVEPNRNDSNAAPRSNAQR
jgi:hypothetical protein